MNYGHFDDPNREYVITQPDTPPDSVAQGMLRYVLVSPALFWVLAD